MINKYILQIHGLPYFNNSSELADLIHIDYSRMQLYVEKGFRFYKRCYIPKKNGSFREIYQPCKELKAIQAWILRNILDLLIPSNQASAYIKGRTIQYHLRPHNNFRYFYCIDIDDFFPSIKSNRVKKIFENIGYSSEAAYLLTVLTTYNGFLPQGGVTSPSLSNLICLSLDKRLYGLTSRRNITYTRYADDMVFSSNNRNELNKTSKTIKIIVKDEKFKLNDDKTRFLGPKKQCKITGLVKDTSNPEFRIGRKKKRIMRSIIFNAYVNGVFLDSKYKSINAINGWLSYLKSVDYKSYQQLLQYIDGLKKK